MSILDVTFWWTGMLVFVVGGLSLFLGIEWALIEVICRYLGWNRKIIEAAREILIKGRKSGSDGRS